MMMRNALALDAARRVHGKFVLSRGQLAHESVDTLAFNGNPRVVCAIDRAVADINRCPVHAITCPRSSPRTGSPRRGEPEGA